MFTSVYGAAHFGKSLLWHASELLFAFFLTEACGLSGAQMGQILGLSLLVNAVADLVIGQALRKGVGTTLAAARTQLTGAILAGVAFAVFAFAGHIDPAWRFGYALAAILAFRLAYAMYDTPQNAILAFATSTDVERARLASVRYIFTSVAKIVLAMIFAHGLQGEGAAVQSARFAWLALAFVAIAVASAGILSWLSARLDPGAPEAPQPADPRRAGPGASQIRLYAMVFATAICLSVFTRLEPYFATFVLEAPPLGGAMMVALAVGGAAGQPVWMAIARRIGLKGALRCAALTLALGAAGFVMLPRGDLILVVAVSALYGIGSGGVHMAQWALLASIGAQASGRLGGTAAFGLFTCCSKVGKAAAVLGLGAMLDIGDYRDAAGGLSPVFLLMIAAPVVGALIVLGLSSGLGVSPARPKAA